MTMDMTMIENSEGVDKIVDGQPVTMMLIKAEYDMYGVAARVPVKGVNLRNRVNCKSRYRRDVTNFSATSTEVFGSSCLPSLPLHRGCFGRVSCPQMLLQRLCRFVWKTCAPDIIHRPRQVRLAMMMMPLRIRRASTRRMP
jgi:hypothetical protein